MRRSDHRPGSGLCHRRREPKLQLRSDLPRLSRWFAAAPKLIGTNSDLTGPSSRGITPACRALISPIEMATGKQAYFVGKPNPLMMRTGLRLLACIQKMPQDRRPHGYGHHRRRGKRTGSDPGADRRNGQKRDRQVPLPAASDLKRRRRHSGLIRQVQGGGNALTKSFAGFCPHDYRSCRSRLFLLPFFIVFLFCLPFSRGFRPARHRSAYRQSSRPAIPINKAVRLPGQNNPELFPLPSRADQYPVICWP